MTEKLAIPEYDVAEELRVKKMTYEEMTANTKKHIQGIVKRSMELALSWGLEPAQLKELNKLTSDLYSAGMTASRHFHVWERAQEDHE